ncbi:MAG TPA: hypothetical protein VN611_04370 [Patescibacteria group bacterium]|nr:hypothetical protein [Patescibacteria group bacterium]
MARMISVLFLTMFITSASFGTARACDDPGGGIWLGITGVNSNHNQFWFSVINLTSYNVTIGTAPDHAIDDFPYGSVLPPGNCVNYKSVTPSMSNYAITTWASADAHNRFPDHCTATVPFTISEGTGAYNFSLTFKQDTNDHPQQAAIVNFAPPYGTTTWKYSQSVSNDNGYYANQPRDGHEGILFAISDTFVLSAFKPNKVGNGGNRFILVITQRYSDSNYRGYHYQWYMD